MLQMFQKIARLLWPPHPSSPSEQLHVWRVGISVMTLVTAATLVLHIFTTFGVASPFVPGFVTDREYTNNAKVWVKARTSDLRSQILDLQVKYCESSGLLAASYNARLNEKLAEYQDLGGSDPKLPDCAVVKSSRGP